MAAAKIKGVPKHILINTPWGVYLVTDTLVLFLVYKDMTMAENRFREYLNNLAVLQGIEIERVNAIVNTYNQNEIYGILEKYGYSMLGVLILIPIHIKMMNK